MTFLKERCIHCGGTMCVDLKDDPQVQPEIKCFQCGRVRPITEDERKAVRKLSRIPTRRSRDKY